MRQPTKFEVWQLITGNKHPTGYGTQKAMSEITGMPYSAIQNWFRPEAKSKPVDLLLRIMLALKEEGSLDRIMRLAKQIEIKQEGRGNEG